MTTDEDQAQAIVLHDLVVIRSHRVGLCFELRRDIDLRRIEPHAAAKRVDGLEASGRDEPRARIVGDAVLRPLHERRTERIVHSLLGEIEIAEETDQCGQDAARFRAIQGVETCAELFRGGRGH